MAIQRQSRRAQLPRIGVVNVDTGADQVWRSVARTAQGIANDLAPFAQKEAEQAGVNAAKAVKRQNLIDFDEDKKPIAFNVPKQFGLVARSAYERVIETRFEESMREELLDKSIEIASTAKSSTDYNAQFSNYLKTMDKAADGRFGEYIANTGGSILKETQLKLELKEQEAARKKAEQYANDNYTNSLMTLEKSAGMTYTTSGVVDLRDNVKDAVIKAQDKFALTKDSVQYRKDLEDVSFYRSVATVNLIQNQSKFFSESQRLTINAALTDPSQISSIQDSVVRNFVLSIHQTRLPLNRLEDLSDHYTKRKNQFDALRDAKKDEWPEQNQSLIADFETQDFNSVSDILNVDTFNGATPEIKEKYIDAQIVDTVQDKLLSFLSTVNVDEFDDDTFKEEVELALLQSNENIDLSFLPDDLQEDFKQIIRLEDSRRNKIAQEIVKLTDTKASIIKLEQEANQKALDDDKAARTALSTELHLTYFKGIKNANNNKNFKLAAEIFSNLIIDKNYDLTLLTPELRAEYNSFLEILAENQAQFNLGESIKQIDRSQILLFETLNTEAQEHLRTGNLAQLANSINKLENLLPQLSGNKRHSAATIKSLSGNLQSLKNDFAKLGKEEQKQLNLNLADEIIKDLEMQAANPTEQEPFITSQRYTRLKKQIEEMFPNDVRTRNDYLSKLQNQYGLSRIEAAKRMFAELYPQGIPENILSEAINAIETQDPEFLKSLENGSKEKEMYTLLSSAKDIYGFKSEFRTQIRGLEELNRVRQSALIQDNKEANAINLVETNRGLASSENIQIYVDKKLKPKLGLDRSDVIDFGNQSFWFTEDGRPTVASLELMKLLGKGIIPKDLQLQLEQEALIPTGRVGTLLSIFMFGMEQEPDGERVNVWSKEVTNQLNETAISRYTTALIRYQLGVEPSAEAAMRNVINQADDIGEGGIKAELEKTLDVKKLSDWLRETYPEANQRAISQLESAAIALGYNADEKQLKERLDVFTDFHFGIDDRIASKEVANIGVDRSLLGFGGTFKRHVKGARTKYLTESEMANMDKAAAQLMYEFLSEDQRNTYFRTEFADTFGRRFKEYGALSLATLPIFGIAAGTEVYPELDGKERVKTPIARQKERLQQFVTVDGQPFFYDIEFKMREIADNTGLYYVLIPNQAGGYNTLRDQTTDVPAVMDVRDFITKETQHPNMLFYSRAFLNERMNDRTGGQFLQFRTFQPATDKIPELNSFDNVPDEFLPLVKAEQAYMFMYRPELLELESNRRQFEILINEGVINDFDVPYFEDFLEVEND